MIPCSCIGRERQWVDLSSLPNNLWCRMLLLYPSCPPYPTYSSFILGWRGPTCSVIACRNCYAHSVILGALLWSFPISTVPLFFEMQGSELHPISKVWVEHGLSVWYNDFLSCCVPFPIILNTQFACFDCYRALSWCLPGPVCHTLKNSLLSGNSQLHQALALHVKLGWNFFLRMSLFSL